MVTTTTAPARTVERAVTEFILVDSPNPIHAVDFGPYDNGGVPFVWITTVTGWDFGVPVEDIASQRETTIRIEVADEPLPANPPRAWYQLPIAAAFWAADGADLDA